MTSAMIDEPPSASKRELIREFLRLSGIQRQIDSGEFFQRFAEPGGPVYAALPGHVTFGQSFEAPMTALRAAYEKHRPVWQDEYESHLNWEFTEQELRDLVDFFATGSARHYLEALPRMRAYVGTNTEHLLEEIVAEAAAAVAALSPRG